MSTYTDQQLASVVLTVSEPDWALLEKGVRYLLVGPLERAVMDHEGDLS